MVGVGSTTITANNIGDDNYNSASDELVLTVLRATQSLFDAGADKNDIKTTDANFTQKPTGVLGNGATTYTTSNGESVVKINLSTGEVEVKGAGITTITVTNAGDDLYQSVSDQYQIIVLKVTQPSFDAGANHLDLTPTSANFTQSATGVLGDGVTTYKSSDTGVAQVDADGNITIITVPFTASTTITATNPGDDTYLPAIDTYQITITPDYFITTWKTTTDNEAIAIPARDDTYLYNYNVDWGDGNTDISLRDYESHTYATAGTYTVKISGTFPAFYSNNFEYSNKLLSIERWGKQKFVSMEKAFKGCENLVINATDTPDLSLLTPISTRTDEMFYGAKNLTSTTGNWAWDTSNVSTMKLMFYGATNFNQDITGWDVSKVTNMEAMFYEAHAFNQDIGNWDVSAVEYMIQMFRYATAFNGNIDNWGNKTANVTSMLAMFYEADAFNQDISGWDVSEVTDMSYMFYNTNAFNKDINSWAVSNVEDMESMFAGADAFNQDIGSWDVSKVSNMKFMFYDADLFNGNVGNWGAKTADVTNMSSMFKNATNFNQDISNWDTSKAEYMISMFRGATSFNQDLNTGNWDTSNVENMSDMFNGASAFTGHDLSGWSVGSVTSHTDFDTGWGAGNTVPTFP